MPGKSTIMLAVGDCIFEEKEADAEVLLELTTGYLRSADVLVGQCEVTYSNRPVGTLTNRIPEPRDPEVMQGLIPAGFNVMTLAGNHVWDLGKPGIVDTIKWLGDRGVAVTGAGIDLEEARSPAILQNNGITFGFLSYNCVGPGESRASREKAGCAFVNVLTHYELDHATPGGTPTAYTGIESDSLQAMLDDIKALRSRCDVLAVSFHKGLVHTPVTVMNYERHLSYAAIDAGADIILGHHAHILHGVEKYKGKFIFHSLGNFAVSLRMTVDPKLGAEQWAVRRKRLFGFEPDPEYPTYPFHPEAVHTMIVKCYIEEKRIAKVNFLPCLVNKKSQPEILKNDDRGQTAFDYIERITNEAGLNAKFAWDGDEITVL